jgi:nonsense-mediated mRNA decay protein 3
VKLTVQKEVLSKTILQKTVTVEFVVANLQCEDCKQTYTPHKWKAQVQVRQKVPHKRTFLFLEQLILKHKAHANCNNIIEVEGGLDFWYSDYNLGKTLVKFI